MTDLKSVYILTWLDTDTVIIADIIASNSVFVEEIQWISMAAWNWVGRTVEISVHAIPALILQAPKFYIDLSV